MYCRESHTKPHLHSHQSPDCLQTRLIKQHSIKKWSQNISVTPWWLPAGHKPLQLLLSSNSSSDHKHVRFRFLKERCATSSVQLAWKRCRRLHIAGPTKTIRGTVCIYTQGPWQRVFIKPDQPCSVIHLDHPWPRAAWENSSGKRPVPDQEAYHCWTVPVAQAGSWRQQRFLLCIHISYLRTLQKEKSSGVNTPSCSRFRSSEGATHRFFTWWVNGGLRGTKSVPWWQKSWTRISSGLI